MRASLRDAFEQCSYRVQIERSVYALQVGEPAGPVERRIPRCCSFSIITAWNARARQMPHRHNLAADRRLLAWLATRQLQHWPALNGEGSWQEDAWLVGNPPLQQLDRLATGLGQMATLHWCRGQPVTLRWHAELTDIMDGRRRAP